jgi:hypothetical protein
VAQNAANRNAGLPATADPLVEGAKQGAADLAGGAIAWPVRAAFRRFGTAPTVARTAAGAIAEKAAAADAVAQAGVESAHVENAMAKRAVKANTAAAMADVNARAAAGRLGPTSQREVARQIAAIDLQAEDRIADILAVSDRLTAPDVLQVGDTARAVVQGPARKARDIAGQRVAQAAESGPALDATWMPDAVNEMVRKAYPPSVFAKASEAANDTIGFISKMTPQAQQRIAAQLGGGAGPQSLEAGIAKAFNLPPEHPLPGILGKIQRMGADTMPFAEMHALKEQLDAAVRWDRSSRSILERVTKGFRTQLRERMRGYQPYDEATDAYRRLSDMWGSGVGERMMRAARKDPSALARVLKPNDPAGAQVVQDILVAQGAAGGDSAAGKQAWNGVRSAFTYDTVIKGDIDGLLGRVEKLTTDHPAFVRATFGDAEGQAVLANLRQIGEAVSRVNQQRATQKATIAQAGSLERAAARERVAAERAAVRTAGAAAMDRVTEESATRLRGAARTANQMRSVPRAERAELRNSSIGRYAGGRNPDAIPGWIGKWALIRHALMGPSGADIVQWAAYSPARTRAFVRAVESPLWDEGNAAFLRAALTAVGADEAPSEK